MTDVHRIWLLVSAALAGWLVYLLSPILTPFLVSALLAYLGDPLVDRLEARGLSQLALGGSMLLPRVGWEATIRSTSRLNSRAAITFCWLSKEQI